MAVPPSDAHEPDCQAAESPAIRSRVRRRVRHGAAVRERRRKIWTYGLLIVSGILMVNALIGEKGYLANLQAQREFQDGSESLRQLKEENVELAEKARRLKADPDALEEAAREELGMIKPGETLIRLSDRPTGRQ